MWVRYKTVVLWPSMGYLLPQILALRYDQHDHAIDLNSGTLLAVTTQVKQIRFRKPRSIPAAA